MARQTEILDSLTKAMSSSHHNDSHSVDYERKRINDSIRELQLKNAILEKQNAELLASTSRKNLQ